MQTTCAVSCHGAINFICKSTIEHGSAAHVCVARVIFALDQSVRQLEVQKYMFTYQIEQQFKFRSILYTCSLNNIIVILIFEVFVERSKTYFKTCAQKICAILELFPILKQQ